MSNILRKFSTGIKGSGLEWKNAAKMGIAATMSLYVILRLTEWIERPDPLANGLWCVVATLVVLQANLGGTYKAIFNRLTGVVIGSVLGALAASLLGTREIALGIAIFATVLICSFLNLKESYRIASLAVTAVMIPWGSAPVLSPWTFAFFRSIDTVIGILLAIFVAYSFWPSTAVNKIQSNMGQLLRQIKKLYDYTLLLKASDNAQHPEEKVIQDLVNEINPLINQNHALIEEARLEVLFRSAYLPTWIELEDCLERLFKIVYTMQTVYNSQLQQIFDEGLKRQSEDLASKIDLAFMALVGKLEAQAPALIMQDVMAADAHLNEQLLRFRETRALRQYSFEDAEHYFVFFYSLRSMVNELKHFNDLLDVFYSERESD